MTTTTSRTDARRGQAAVETAIGLTVFAFVVAALVGFSDVFLRGFTQLTEARTEAGIAALTAADGEIAGSSAIIIKQTADPKESDWRHAPAAGSYTEAWTYPQQVFGSGSDISTWRQTSSPFVHKRAFRTEEFPLDLSLLGSGALFPDAITVKESALLPVTGGPR